MKYFRVERQEIVGDIIQGEIDRDGMSVDLPDTIVPNETIDLGLVVYELDKDGNTTDIRYEYKSLKDIKRDYPPTEWQNNNW